MGTPGAVGFFNLRGTHGPVYRYPLLRGKFTIFKNCLGTPGAVGFFNLKDTHGLVYRYPLLRGQFTIPNI